MSEQDPDAVEITPIDAAFAARHAGELLELAHQIPKAPWDAEDITGAQKADGRTMHAKWGHSFALMDGDRIAGFVMAYERNAESNDNYPTNTFYITGLAVRPGYQRHGYAGLLMRAVLEPALEHGFTELDDPVVFSLQTNAADWNLYVRQFYESLGFVAAGKKQYDNRTDVVMRASSDQVAAALQSQS